MKKYFLHNGSEQQGPFDLEELKLRGIKNDTPVWYEGLPEWTTAGNIQELKDIIVATPPPLRAATPPAIEKPTHTESYSTNAHTRKSSTGRRLIVAAIVIVLGLIAVFIYNQIDQQQSEKTNNNNKDFTKQNITNYVTAETNEYTYNKLGGIYNLKITVNNNTEYLIDKVQVNITYFKSNGEVWDTKLIEFNLLSAQTQQTISVDDTERGTSIKCDIVSINSAALNMY